MQGVWEQNWELEIGQALDGFEILLPTNGRVYEQFLCMIIIAATRKYRACSL